MTAENPLLTPEQDQLVSKLGELVAVMEDSKDTDSARWQKANEERESISARLQVLEEERQKEEHDKATQKAIADLQAWQASMRAPSKASAIGGALAGGSGAYDQGAFIGSLFAMKDALKNGDVVAAQKARADLDAISEHTGVPAYSKATLGSTDATGGWIIPNAIVDDLIKPATYKDPFAGICTDVPGVTAFAVDIPFRNARPNKAVVAPFGNTKENVDLGYDGYTATMYTIARIHDLGAQFVRQSRGAAERDVMGELATAFALGTEYYTVQGTGSSQPYGIVTAFSNAPATFTTSFTASATTLAGSVLTAIATASGDLAGRDRVPNAAVVSATMYWTMLSQGTANSGFFFAGLAGMSNIPNVASGTLVTPFGIPVIPDSQFPTDDLVVGDFKVLKRYFGQTYRVDTSTEAGSRWDDNLVGFRGEMEFGLDARPAVYAGALQYVADIQP